MTSRAARILVPAFIFLVAPVGGLLQAADAPGGVPAPKPSGAPAKVAVAKPDPATLVIGPRQRLSKNDKELRRATFRLCREMLDAPAGKYGAHPSSAVFPGLVDAKAERITKTLALAHTPPDEAMMRLIRPLGYSGAFNPTLQSTGLYAAPGEVVEVEIPQSLVGKISVQVGIHSDNLNQWVAAGEDWRRMPLIVNSRKLDAAKTRISNPFGGLVYISCPPDAPAWQGEVKIANAVAAPLYVPGKTTDAEWTAMLASTGAPWGEIAGANIVLTLPTKVLRKMDKPAERMAIWDRVVGATMDLAQLPMPFYRQQRMVTDPHIGGGFMHSGYPIMVHHCPEVGMSTEDFIANPDQFSHPAKGGPNWGFFHEIGHNMQNLDWVFDGTTEVSVNFFSLYCFDHVAGGREDAHGGISNEASQRMLEKYFSKPADFKAWKQDPFLGLLTFRFIQTEFGWDLFKKTFRRYHALSETERPRSDQQKRDLLVQYMSESAQRDFSAYFEAWGIPLSPAVKESLRQYPSWMPYNFPVRKD